MKLNRRTVVRSMSAALAMGTAVVGPGRKALADQIRSPATFVLVHGAWHGGWCWQNAAAILRSAGHTVYTPTQTGLGERSHLLSRDITIDTFVDDVANLIRWEQLKQVVLVGHSFGGLTISGVADRMPERLRKLVYLDSLILEDGQTPFSVLPKETVAARLKAADESSKGLSLPVPDPKDIGLLLDEDQRFVASRLTPHPLSTYTSPMKLRNPIGNGVPVTYITCSAPSYAPISKSFALAASRGWPISELNTGHVAMVSAPSEVARELMYPTARESFEE
jgi:pimeloyl-ACP methyl ester carboxylesterase